MAEDLQSEVDELRRARQSANARQAELMQQAGVEVVEIEASASSATATIAVELEGLRGRVGLLEQENAELSAAAQAMNAVTREMPSLRYLSPRHSLAAWKSPRKNFQERSCGPSG
jgi:hypothetical protein